MDHLRGSFELKLHIQATIMVKYGTRSLPSIVSAIELAQRAHAGQTRIGGEDYILHCLRVGWRVARWAVQNYWSEETAVGGTIAAILHDVVEDTSVMIEEIEAAFGEFPARLVLAVSHESEDELDEVYFRRIADRGMVAVVIKRFDILDNIEVGLPQAPVEFRRQKVEGRWATLPLWNRIDPEGAGMIADTLKQVKLN